jgi:proliferating cell nuclear antigen PCNA
MTLSSTMTSMLKKLLEVVANVSELAVIRFSPTGAQLQTMDPTRVCLVDVHLPESWFENYKCPTACDLSTSMGVLVKVLGCAERGQNAVLRTTTSKSGEGWELVLSGGGEGTFRKEFMLPLYNLDDEVMDIPEMEADVDFVMSAGHWAKTLDELAIFGKDIKVTCGDDGTTLAAKEVESGSGMSCLIGLDDVTSYEACDETIELEFSAKLLQQTAAARHASCLGPVGDVAVHFSEGRPVDIEYQLGEGAAARFLIAPRVGD